MRAAAKRRSQAELGCGVGPRRGVYGAFAGRLTAKRRSYRPRIDRGGRESRQIRAGVAPGSWAHVFRFGVCQRGAGLEIRHESKRSTLLTFQVPLVSGKSQTIKRPTMTRSIKERVSP